MSRKIQQYLAVLILSLSFFIKAIGQDIPAQPNPPLLVSDFVMKLKPEERNALEQKLRGYRDSTSTEIAIVIVKNTGESDPYDYAMKIAKTWGVGAKNKNNGVLLLWATETRKIRIVTGRGIEDVLPDAICKRIINTILVPNFKQQQWYQGLNEATDEMIQRASGEFKSDATSDDDSPLGFFIIVILIILFIVISIIISKRGGGGGRGGYRGGGWTPPIIITGGSSWGNRSGGGGGDSGFDFGGFGGGDFGGGGAGGDY